MINVHLTKITKFIDLENLELYGTYVATYDYRLTYVGKGGGIGIRM